MKSLILAVALLGAMAGSAAAQTAACPSFRTVVYVHGSADPTVRKAQRDLMIAQIAQPDTIVRLTPDVDFDFGDVSSLPIQIGHCSQLVGVAESGPQTPVATTARRAPAAGTAATGLGGLGGVRPPAPSSEGRTSHTPGPVLRFGKHTPALSDTTALLETRCGGGFNGEGVRIAGFRLFGPSFGDQTTNEVGIRVNGCHQVEVANMEIAGWGGAGVDVVDSAVNGIPAAEPAGGIQVMIHDSYFHDDRHPSAGGTLGIGGHAEGYGVVASEGAFLRVFQSVFDNNRHAVAANGKAGGYHAERNLILKGGGYHGAWYEAYTHIMDAHGTGCWWSSDQCGDAGRSFLIRDNVFQYTSGHDIHMRGSPKNKAIIESNSFARADKDDAIDGNDNDRVTVRNNNSYGVDDFGRYDVCDFDGDGIDDLFFATGRTWWFSGQGRFAWTFLQETDLPHAALRFGDFDGDGRCDVAAELPAGTGQWFISKGGATNPFVTHLADLGHPANEVVFGRFDPGQPERTPGAQRKLTHAFWRRGDGQWFVTALNSVNWVPVASSSFPLKDLKFGDFTGDGVTDVLAVVGGHWAISDAARGGWRQINTLGDPVGPLYVANMDRDDNIDDLLKLERKVYTAGGPIPKSTVTETWWRSKNAVEPWKVWKTYTWTYPVVPGGGLVAPTAAFAGRFGPTPLAGATLTIDPYRRGQFAGGKDGKTAWQSGFGY